MVGGQMVEKRRFFWSSKNGRGIVEENTQLGFWMGGFLGPLDKMYVCLFFARNFWGFRLFGDWEGYKAKSLSQLSWQNWLLPLPTWSYISVTCRSDAGKWIMWYFVCVLTLLIFHCCVSLPDGNGWLVLWMFHCVLQGSRIPDSQVEPREVIHHKLVRRI